MSSKIEHTHLLKHLTVAVLIILLVIFVTVRRAGNHKQPGAVTDTTASQETKTTGTMKLVSQQDQQIYLLGQEIDLFLYASSQQSPVIGYDAVLNFDTAQISYDTSENMLAAFDFFVHTSPDGVAITAVKKLAQEKGLVFTDTPLARLTFIAKKQGVFTIEPAFRPGATDDSNLVTVQSSDILSDRMGYLGYVGQETRVLKGSSKQLPDSSITLKLDEVVIPAPQCADCDEKVVLSVSQGDKVEKLTFIQGGLEGKPFDARRAFEMIFEIGDYDESSAYVRYAHL